MKSSNTWDWGNHSICGSDIPRINPGTGFPSGPRIPCRAPGTVKRRRVSVLQRASHIKEPLLWRWLAAWQATHSATSPAHSQQPVTPPFVTDARHTFKGNQQSSTKANMGQKGCPLWVDSHTLARVKKSCDACVWVCLVCHGRFPLYALTLLAPHAVYASYSSCYFSCSCLGLIHSGAGTKFPSLYHAEQRALHRWYTWFNVLGIPIFNTWNKFTECLAKGTD